MSSSTLRSMWIVIVVVLLFEFASTQTASTSGDVTTGTQVSVQENTDTVQYFVNCTVYLKFEATNGQLESGFPANFFTPYFPSFGPSLPLASSADAVKEEKTTAPQQLQTSFNLGFPSQGRPFNFGQLGINGLSGGGAASADVDTAQPGPVVGFYGTVPNIGTHLGLGGTSSGAAGNGFGTLVPKQNQALAGLGSSAGAVTNQLPQQQLETSGLGLFGNNFPSFNFGPSFPSHPSPPAAEGTPVTSIQDTINKPGGQ